jgi:phage major head subunit gpT-like protein
MPVPHVSDNFQDILDPRFERILDEELAQLPDMIPQVYSMPPTNGRDNIRWSDVGTLPDWQEFNGQVQYKSQAQGYDTVSTPLEFTSGVQVERKLFDDDQYNVMDQRPRALAASYNRTRQVHGARMFNNAFSTDTFFYVNSESVALCSNSHTTNSGASTAAGFDNLGTAALTATAVAAARIQMVNYRDDQGGRFSVMPDRIYHPVDLYEEAFEIIAASGKVDVATNNPNVHQGKYEAVEWNYLTDTNNWFMTDSRMQRQFLMWIDRVPVEFAMVEDFDKLIAKWRGYARYSNAWTNWRFIFGSQVS